MKLFKIIFTCYDYDQYDAFVVAAKKQEDVLPLIQSKYDCSKFGGVVDVEGGYRIEEITGKRYKEPIVIIESFNAG
jgi:hypothetical protein